VRDQPYYYGIDLIRFFAAFSVLSFHLAYLNNGANAEYLELRPVAWQGWIGVQIFFVISGFVIANSASVATPSQFIRGRALRLYPAAWICATITFIALGAPGEWSRYVRSMLLIPKGPWVDDVYWTLAVEISFYAMTFVMLCIGAFKLISHAAFVVTVFNAICLVVLATNYHDLGDVISRMNLTLANHGCFFALGIWIWCAAGRPLKYFEIAGIMLAIGTGILQIYLYASKYNPYPEMIWLSEPILIWLVSVAAIVLFSRVQLAPSKLLRRLGLMTYPLYLVHNVLGRAIESRLLNVGVNRWIALAVAASTVIAISWVVCVALEPQIRLALKKAGAIVPSSRSPRAAS
jgi:peptidoglycan/LPS O-acetylase OafA/YrhL